MTDNTEAMPPLPEPTLRGGPGQLFRENFYTAAQMREAQRSALAALRAGQQVHCPACGYELTTKHDKR